MTAASPAITDAGPPPVDSRHRSLSAALSGLRRPQSGSFPVAKVLLVAGGLCLPVGIVVIIVGWYGTAHTLNLYEQNSYMLSGGFLGLGLVMAGGFLYFGYWMTRQLEVAKATLQRMDLQFARMESQLAAVSASTGTPGHGLPTVHTELSPAPGSLVATEKGSLAHRRDCQVVAGRANLRRVAAGDKSFRACQICQPYEDS